MSLLQIYLYVQINFRKIPRIIKKFPKLKYVKGVIQLVRKQNFPRN